MNQMDIERSSCSRNRHMSPESRKQILLSCTVKHHQLKMAATSWSLDAEAVEEMLQSRGSASADSNNRGLLESK